MAEVREHDQTSALAAAVEQARIARDMHDSVSAGVKPQERMPALPGQGG